MARGRGRGRGRGAARGRGAPRGRGVARGRVGQRHQRRPARGSAEAEGVWNKELETTMDFSKDVKPLFLDAAPFEIHLRAQEADKFHLVATMLALERNKVDIQQSAKVKCLAAAWARHDHELANLLLQRDEIFGVVEVLKALQVLDSGRKERFEEKKLAQMKSLMTTAGKVGKSRIGRKMAALKVNVHNLGKLKPLKGTVSGALARHIKRWTRQLTKDQLEFFALHLPTETWKQLSDICHLHPEKDFPNLPWFLKFCFVGESVAPPGSLAHECQGLNESNVNEYLNRLEIPFSHIKKFAATLTPESKAKICGFTKDLDSILWNYEDLKCPETDSVIMTRLNQGDKVTLPYGKLMERLLYMRKLRRNQELRKEPITDAPFYQLLLPSAENILKSISISVESPVVVIGDASGSMEVAIETATIIGSFLTALTKAQLVFFSDSLIEAPFVPETVERVLELAMTVKTVGSTCHAAGLLPYYEKKQIVKTFIITTDEEENANITSKLDGVSYRFLPLFKKYHAEVYPARLVFVSFLHQQHSEGQMVGPLRAEGFDVMQFKLDGNRPDLTKLDNLVGQMAHTSEDFDAQVSTLEATLKREGMQNAFNQLRDLTIST